MVQTTDDKKSEYLVSGCDFLRSCGMTTDKSTSMATSIELRSNQPDTY